MSGTQDWKWQKCQRSKKKQKWLKTTESGFKKISLKYIHKSKKIFKDLSAANFNTEYGCRIFSILAEDIKVKKFT